MAVVEELLRAEADGAISCGNHKLGAKAKLEDYEHAGNLWKVKTYKSMTKLEKNCMFTYESVPGTSVNNFVEKENGVEFLVEGEEDAQITIGLEDDMEYDVYVNDEKIGRMKTNLSGKLNISVELSGVEQVAVKVIK